MRTVGMIFVVALALSAEPTIAQEAFSAAMDAAPQPEIGVPGEDAVLHTASTARQGGEAGTLWTRDDSSSPSGMNGLPEYCGTFCTESLPCDTVCCRVVVPGGGFCPDKWWTTCGDWGVCQDQLESVVADNVCKG